MYSDNQYKLKQTLIMSIDKRAYHRIITDIPCQFGQEKQFYSRQVNISAGGIAFIVMPEMVEHFTQGERIPLMFELNRQNFHFDTYVVRRTNNSENKTVVALQFLNVDESTQKTLDDMILAMGGYKNNELDKKRKYLEWYAPSALHHNGTSVPEKHDISTLKEAALEHETEDADIEKINDLFKEFGY